MPQMMTFDSMPSFVLRRAQAREHALDHARELEAAPRVQHRRVAHLHVADVLARGVLGELVGDAPQGLLGLHDAQGDVEGLQVLDERAAVLAEVHRRRAARRRRARAARCCCFSASSRMVASRSEPSRWTCRSVFGSFSMSSRGIVRPVESAMKEYTTRPAARPRAPRRVHRARAKEHMHAALEGLEARRDPLGRDRRVPWPLRRRLRRERPRRTGPAAPLRLGRSAGVGRPRSAGVRATVSARLAVSARRAGAAVGAGDDRHRRRDRDQGRRRRARGRRQRGRRGRRDGVRARRRVPDRGQHRRRRLPRRAGRRQGVRARLPRDRARGGDPRHVPQGPTANPRATRARAGARRAFRAASPACGRRGTRSARRTETWAELLAPAIRLADQGFVVDEAVREDDRDRAGRASRSPRRRPRLFLPDGAPPAVGTTWRDPDLANVLRRIAATDQGRPASTKGPWPRRSRAP